MGTHETSRVMEKISLICGGIKSELIHMRARLWRKVSVQVNIRRVLNGMSNVKDKRDVSSSCGNSSLEFQGHKHIVSYQVRLSAKSREWQRGLLVCSNQNSRIRNSVMPHAMCLMQADRGITGTLPRQTSLAMDLPYIYIPLSQRLTVTVGRLKSSRVSTNCPIASRTALDGWSPSKKRFCSAGSTSVTASGVSS